MVITVITGTLLLLAFSRDSQDVVMLYLKGQGSLTFFDEAGEVTQRVTSSSSGR
jgi:hypothetical protein